MSGGQRLKLFSYFFAGGLILFFQQFQNLLFALLFFRLFAISVEILFSFCIISISSLFLLVSMNALAFQAGKVPLFVSFHGFECVQDSMGTDILSR